MSTSLFRYGRFRLHSLGRDSRFKIDCDALTDRDLQAIVALILSTHRFRSVEGIARGGSRLARLLAYYCDPKFQTHLIVDDVLTTGRSIQEALNRTKGRVEAVVIFSRREPYLMDDRVSAIFQLGEHWRKV